MNKQIYHYTNLNALLGILNSIKKDENNLPVFTLRATNINYLNDYSEGQLLPRVLSKMGIPMPKQFGDIYITSFSNSLDSLSMWRGYAKDGEGVALCFDTEVINNYLKEHYSFAVLKDCIYTNESKLCNILNSQNIQQSKMYVEAAKYKDEGFIEENECRLIVNTSTLQEKYECKNNTIVPYIEIELPVNVLFHLSSIWLGPMVNEDKTRSSIERIWKQKIGMYDELYYQCIINVIKSQISYTNK